MADNETDIERFLRSVVDRLGDVDDGTYRMFRMLVETALSYRDELADNGETLTVVETQGALDAFMEVMKTHDIPKQLPAHVHQLVVRWLQEIKKTVHH